VTRAASPAPGAPRVLLFSQRNAGRYLWHAPQYEMEDVIAEVDAVRMVAPQAIPRPPMLELGRRAVDIARLRLGRLQLPEVQNVEVTLDGEYDLFFAVFHFPYQLEYLHRMRGWRERCRKAVAFVVEFWSPEVAPYTRYVEMLAQFDRVFVFNPTVIDPIARITGRAPGYLPAGVDAIRFSPWPDPPERTIDVLSYGRRSKTTHDQLAAMAERREIYYLHDTTAQSPMIDFRQHRVLLASNARRSRYGFAYRINEDRLVRTGGDEGLTTRLFELSAAGVVMLGTAPRCAEFGQLFDWPDALIDLPWEPRDVAASLAELDAQPERIAEARLQNAVNALRRHDWSYRWKQVLDSVGMPALPAFDERLARLESLAALAEGEARAARVAQ
jgi:hypothetical protein